MKNSEQNVYIAKDEKIGIDSFSNILIKIGVLDNLVNAKSVLIKPNLAAAVNYKGDSGILVSPSMMENLIQCIRSVNRDAKITIAESDSTGKGYAYLKFENQGYHNFIEKYAPLELVDLSRDRLKRVPVDGFYFEHLDLGESLFHSDFVVSIAKIKTHNMTTMTGATKNLFGCLPDIDKSHFHTNLDKVIADLSKSIKVDLAIVDGNPGMMGNGPVKGTPISMKRILIGNNAITTDAVQTHIMGLNPSKIKHLVLSSRANHISLTLEDINIYGCSIQNALVRIEQIGLAQKSIVWIGLKIQSIGNFIYTIGHKIHFQKNYIDVAKVLAREGMLLVFKHDTLRKIKKRVLR